MEGSAGAAEVKSDKPRRRGWLGRWSRRGALVLVVVSLVGWWVGCTSMVRPPVSPRQPTSVFLLKNGFHRGLLLPTSTGYVEYGYGEWEWYGRGNDAWYRVFPTVLWSTQGGLGVRSFSVASKADLIERLSYVELQEITVERERVDALRAELDRRWKAGREQMGEEPSRSYGFLFVPVDKGYWLLNNCCDEVARWLEALDCAVAWVPVRLDLEVEDS